MTQIRASHNLDAFVAANLFHHGADVSIDRGTDDVIEKERSRID